MSEHEVPPRLGIKKAAPAGQVYVSRQASQGKSGQHKGLILCCTTKEVPWFRRDIPHYYTTHHITQTHGFVLASAILQRAAAVVAFFR